MILAYDEFVDFLAGGTASQGVIDFHPSEKTKTRVAELIRLQKSMSLSPEDTAELDHYLEVEHIMRLAKARARQRLAAGQPPCRSRMWVPNCAVSSWRVPKVSASIA